MRSFIRDLASVIFSKGALIVFGLAKAIVLARWLGPDNVGILASLLVYPSIFITFGSLGLRQATTYLVGQNLIEEAPIKQAIVHIWFLSSTISVIACFLLVHYVGNAATGPLLAMLAVAPVPFTLFNHYNQGLFLGRNEIRGFNKINWIPALIVLVATVVLIVGLGLGIRGALIATIVGPAFMSILLGIRNGFHRAVSFQVRWSVVRQLLSLGMIYAISLLVINLNYKIDIILMDRLSTDYETGIYAKGAELVELLWQIPMIVSTIVFARSATAKEGVQFSRKVVHLLRISLMLAAGASIAFVLFADHIMRLMFGQQFVPSAQVVVVLLPGVLMLVFFKVLNMDLAGKGKPWIALKAMTPSLLINVALNFLWIPPYGAIGAALASTISYSVAGVVFMIAYSSETTIAIKDMLRFRLTDFEPLFRIVRSRTRMVTK